MADMEPDRRLDYARHLIALGNPGCDLSELTVWCRGHEWKVHHFILRMYGYFDSCLDFVFQVSLFEEGGNI